MEREGEDYWRTMFRVKPTLTALIAKAERQEDMLFEASVLHSILTLPGDKAFPQHNREVSWLELLLKSNESGLFFKAYSVLSFHYPGVGDLQVPKASIDAARALDSEIKNRTGFEGVFGGRPELFDYLTGNSKFINLRLGYAAFPKGSGKFYLFERSTFDSKPQ